MPFLFSRILGQFLLIKNCVLIVRFIFWSLNLTKKYNSCTSAYTFCEFVVDWCLLFFRFTSSWRRFGHVIRWDDGIATFSRDLSLFRLLCTVLVAERDPHYGTDMTATPSVTITPLWLWREISRHHICKASPETSITKWRQCATEKPRRADERCIRLADETKVLTDYLPFIQIARRVTTPNTNRNLCDWFTYNCLVYTAEWSFYLTECLIIYKRLWFLQEVLFDYKTLGALWNMIGLQTHTWMGLGFTKM